MHPDRALVPMLFMAGLIALLAAGFVLAERDRRPDASGDVGVLEVYGQQRDGPIRVWPDRPISLPRPQHIAFRFSAEGTGPRMVRIEVETSSRRYIAYERFHYAPASNESLEYVLQLAEETEDDAALWTTIEAPHARAVTSRFPVRLTGSRKRFWEPGSRPAAKP